MFLNLWIFLPLIAILVGLRFLRPGTLVWTCATWVAVFVALNWGFKVGIPQSVVMLYMAIVTLALFTYVSSSEERWQGFYGPIERLCTEPGRRPWLFALLALVPLVAAGTVWSRMSVPIQAPSFGRTIHPAPPDTVEVHGKAVDLIAGHNPYRELKGADPEAWAAHVENGRRVYFQNCFYCHGDGMGGDGMFAYALNPIPSNFTDKGVLPNLQETFIFWRIAKGGPGLPEEGGPWDTAMPAWENFLTEEEMWDATLFLYEFMGYEPRALVEHH